MKKIAFFFRQNEALICFTPLSASLFSLWGLESIHIQHVIAGNDIKAGEFTLSYFKKTNCNILIVEDCISIPENIPHITFNFNDNFSVLLSKITVYEESLATKEAAFDEKKV